MKTSTIPTKKTVAAFKDYDFENCNVPEQYQGDYPHHNFCKKVFVPILRRELKKLAEKTNSELVSFQAWRQVRVRLYQRRPLERLVRSSALPQRQEREGLHWRCEPLLRVRQA